MDRPKILVVGATGKTGGAVVTELVARGWPVRALVRRQDERSDRLRRLGAELAQADLHDRDAMRTALDGIGRAYWVSPFHSGALAAATLFAELAAETRLEAVVTLSQWLASPNHPSLATRHAYAIERCFAGVPGLVQTIVNPGFFADNYLRLIGFAAKLGVLPSLTGDSRNAPPSNDDIARVAVAALLDPGRHGGQTYRPTGPALLSTRDMAGILSDVLGRTVRRVEMPMWLFLKAARLQGVDPFELSGYRYYVQDHRQGAFAVGAPSDVVARVTGRPPESFDTIARRYARMSDAQRSVPAVLAAWMNFMRTPLMPGYDLDRFDRLIGVTLPPRPLFALEDPAWRQTHGIATASAI